MGLWWVSGWFTFGFRWFSIGIGFVLGLFGMFFGGDCFVLYGGFTLGLGLI